MPSRKQARKAASPALKPVLLHTREEQVFELDMSKGPVDAFGQIMKLMTLGKWHIVKLQVTMRRTKTQFMSKVPIVRIPVDGGGDDGL